jgi:hypothetical protein
MSGRLSIHKATTRPSHRPPSVPRLCHSYPQAPPETQAEGEEEMEAFVLMASVICALIGVSISRFGDSDLDRAIKQADRASAGRRAMGKAIGHE